MSVYSSLPGDAGISPGVWQWAKNLVNMLNARDATLTQGSARAGMTSGFLGAVAPSGWLLRDGAVLPIASYPTLAAIYGNTYGGVPGVSFALDTVPQSIVKY